MKVGIVGAGFTGLVAGYELLKAGHKVIIVEKEKKVGGLAGDFKPKDWNWGLEKYYHHIFSGDKEIISLANEVGWPAFFERPITNSLIGGKEKQLDSPLSLLKFDAISFWSRIRMGAGLAGLKIVKDGLYLEKYEVVDVLPKLVGKEGYEKVWKPLLVAKFGKFLPKVNMSWFWARVNKRTSDLGYFEKGFGGLAEKIAEEIEKMGGEIRLDTNYKGDKKEFDKVLFTIPAPIATDLTSEEPALGSAVTQATKPSEERSSKIDYLWGQTLVLELEKSLMDGYWLNILEEKWPFLVVVEQTNFVDKKYYGGKHVVYLGNYLEDRDKRLEMSEEGLLGLYLPYLKKINPDFGEKWIRRKWKFQDPFAQPVFPVNYSKQLPSIRTKISGVYVANMSMVYPWDRGVNFAVELGQKAAKVMTTGSTSEESSASLQPLSDEKPTSGT